MLVGFGLNRLPLLIEFDKAFVADSEALFSGGLSRPGLEFGGVLIIEDY